MVGVLLTIATPGLERFTGLTMSPWLDVLLCFALSGAFGGVLGAIQVADISTLLRSSLSAHWTPFRAYNVTLALVIGALGGIGGAIAAMLVMALDSKIAIPVQDTHRLIYIGMGTVAGFLGFKLLGKIAERVGTWLEIEKEVKKQVERSTTEIIAQERKRADELISAITKALAAQEPHASERVVADAVAALERVRGEAPDNRTAAMMLGWLYASKQNDIKKAIAVLTDALGAMKARRTEEPQNVADVLYNRACYFYRLAEGAQEAEKSNLKASMYKDLEDSVRLKPENAQDALNEPHDFENVKSDAEFRRLVGQRTD